MVATFRRRLKSGRNQIWVEDLSVTKRTIISSLCGMVSEQNTILYIVVPKHSNYTYREVTAQCWQNKLSACFPRRLLRRNQLLTILCSQCAVMKLRWNFWRLTFGLDRDLPLKRRAEQIWVIVILLVAGLTCERSISGAAKISIECLLRVSIDFFRRKIDRLA